MNSTQLHKNLKLLMFVGAVLIFFKAQAAPCSVTFTQPSNSTICSGANTSFSISGSTGSCSAISSYQWQVSTNGGGTWANVVNGGIYNGATTATLSLTSPNATYNTYQYRCVATCGTGGACGVNSANSNAAILTVNSSPSITTQPSNSTATTCTSTTFTVGVTGAGLTYQWKENGVNITNGGVYSGATSSTLTLTNPGIGLNGNVYTCVISGTCAPSATTNNATLTVNACALAYPTSSATSAADEDIFNVTISTLNNSSTCATTGGAGSTQSMYSNYTALSAPTLTQGVSYPFSVQIGTCGGNYSNAVKIFIDYNQDGDFVDAGEEVYVSAVSTSGPHTEVGNILIPLTATLGNTRMRVVNVETGTPSSIVSNATYTWGETEDYTITIASAGPMIYSSCTTTQSNTSTVQKCEVNQQVIGIEIAVTGSSSPLSLTQIQLNMNGSTIPGTNTNDVTKIHIYYTGTSSTFAAVGAFDGAGTNPAAGTITINGAQTLTPGTNYFWVAYDMNFASSTLGNLIDAQCTQLTIAGINRIPTVQSPAGSRTIAICNPSPGGVSTGLETWIRADIGVTGTSPVTAWTNQKATGTAVLVNGAPTLDNTTTAYNYNPYVRFSAPAGTLSDGLAANRQCLKLSGYSDLAGINYTSLFFALELDDLTRSYTHLATVQGVTYSFPANGTLHGDDNGGFASLIQESYDINDFGTSAPAGTWRRNGLNVASNSLHTSQKQVLSASCYTGGSTTINVFLGGQIDQFDPNAFAGHNRDWKGPCAEIIGYTSVMTATERQKIDSYLAIKYGMTLTFNYLATNAGTVFTVAAPYNNNIIGIGRDDIEMLTQKQSHNDDDTVRIYLNTLAAMNASNTGSFTNDISYVMAGATTGKMCATSASVGEMPFGLTNCDLYSRLEREWKVTRTNMAQNFNMDFKLAACGAPGSVVVSDLRLLVDDDGNFANGGTQCYYNGDGTGIVISYSNPTITVSGISTTHIPNNATKYITIASIQVITPLPTELLSFDAKLNSERAVDVYWTTASEINSDYFTVEKSYDATNWEVLGNVKAAGNSTVVLNYSLVDYNPHFGYNYYRLKQYDMNGDNNSSDIRLVNLSNSGTTQIYPNPASSTLFIRKENIEKEEISLTDQFGKVIAIDLIASGTDIYEINVSNISSGIYFININGLNGLEVHKIVID